MDIMFSLDSLPTEAEKYSALSAETIGGGIAANAAVAISRLGGSAFLVAQLGDDIIGKGIIADLISEGVNIDYVTCSKAAKSSYSSVYLDLNGERQIVNYRGKNLRLDTAWTRSPATFDAVLVDTRIPEAAAQALDMATSHQVPAIVDAEAPIDTSLLSKASHVAFSSQGLASLHPDLPSPQALAAIASTYQVWACVTDGPNHILYTTDDGIQSLPAYQIEPRDTLAAGDVWHGAFALALAECKDEVKAMQFANATAAYKCTQLGGRLGTPSRQQLNAFIRENNP
jgi:sulfofructose kinase